MRKIKLILILFAFLLIISISHAAQYGLLPLVLTGSTMLVSDEVVAAVLEHGSEYVVKEAASLGTTEAEAIRFGTNMAGAINKLLFLGATKLVVKVVKGSKSTVKPLSPKESAAISKQSFREMQTKPVEFEASVSKGISEAAKKNPILRMEMEKLADAINQRPYNSRAMESLLKTRYGEDAVSSTTMTDIGGRNVGLSGMGHPKTGIPFTEKGAPIFDNVAVCDLSISREIASVKNEILHFKAATNELNRLIETGVISKSHFSAEALLKIQKGEPHIPGFTWHHHEDFSRMQLVPRQYHGGTGHDGGMKYWPFTAGE